MSQRIQVSQQIQTSQAVSNSQCLQADFYQLPAASDEANYRLFQFGAGENHVQLLVPPAKRVTLFFGYRGDQSIMQLLLLTDALRRSGAELIDLLLPYMPGARQDRVCNVGEALSVKVYASLINQQQYASVSVFDPHSDVTAALLDRVLVIDNHSFVAAIAAQLTGDLVLVSPDAGIDRLFCTDSLGAPTHISSEFCHCHAVLRFMNH